MSISLFDLFSIGIGPSSSHTVGPMLAAHAFLEKIDKAGILNQVHRLETSLYGSLALTGKGHGTDKAILNGLEGKRPDTVDPSTMVPRMQAIIEEKTLQLNGAHAIPFDIDNDLCFHQKKTLPKHSNGMRFTVYDTHQKAILSQVYYSIGGGFITTAESFGQDNRAKATTPLPFHSAAELLRLCEDNKFGIDELMLENERAFRDTKTIHQGILHIASVMNQCIDAGCKNTGELPGGLNVKRRAPELQQKLLQKSGITTQYEKEDLLNFVNLFAIAVNEENAAGGRIVTAPTNGAAGIIPAVLRYLQVAHNRQDNEAIYTYFLTAGAIGILYKEGASISGAEVGCQGEVGVASSMAAAALTAVLGGSIYQIENAAEIAMEHHLGMTCDPVAGLVQIPCIERNAMGAVKAINASRLALSGDGTHFIPLDNVINTMLQTGKDMQSIYKETSLGGLAVNFPEC